MRTIRTWLGFRPEGAEDLAARCWAYWGGRVERWSFDWNRPQGTVVLSRHRRMIEAGADVCLGFAAMAGPRSLTTMARSARVPTYDWIPPCATPCSVKPWRPTLAMMTEPEGELFADAHAVGVTREVRGAILQRYYDEGGPEVLGLPTSGERPVTVEDLSPYGDREVTFTSGVIVCDSRSGTTTLLRLHEQGTNA